jgi:hypothetical protein
MLDSLSSLLSHPFFFLRQLFPSRSPYLTLSLLSLEQAQTRKITKHNTINKSCLHSIKTTKIIKNNQQIKQNESPKIINKLINEDETSVPGGSAQTRDYYSDSSSRRRKSLDRSNSIRKTAAAVVAEIDELKWGDAGRILCGTIARRPSKWGDAGRILCGTIARRPSKWGDAGRIFCGTIAQRHIVCGGKWGAKGVVQEVQAVEQGVEQRGEGVGEGSCGEDWSVGKGGAADLERERIEGRGGG